MSSLRLSEKHGVNPMIPCCFYCNKNKNEILLMGKMKGDVEAPRGQVIDRVPCDECASYMQQGILFIEIRNDEPQSDNPYRMGGWAVLKEDAVLRILDEDNGKAVIQRRVCFIETRAWDSVGLPRGENNASA